MTQTIINCNKTTVAGVALVWALLCAACAPLAAPPAPTEPVKTAIVATQEIAITATQSPEEAATIVADKAAVAAKISPLPPVTPEMAPTGIYDDAYYKAEWLKQGFVVQNAWFGLEGGNVVTVYAGAFADDPKQGALKLVMNLSDRALYEEFRTSEKHGSLKVVAEKSNRLTLMSEDGTTLYFDVPGHRFVNTFDEKVPVATVPATYTPLPTPGFSTRPTSLPTGYPGLP